MALRDKLHERVSPRLEPDERLDAVFPAQTGPSPYFILLSALVVFMSKHYVFAVTDRRIVVFRASRWSVGTPKEEVASQPRGPGLGDPGTGLWGRVEFAGTRYWVHRRFRDDVLAAAPPSPAPASP